MRFSLHRLFVTIVTFAFASVVLLEAPRAFGAEISPWKSVFTEASSKEMAATHEAIHAPHVDALRAHPVSNLVWTEQDFTLEMKSGTIFLEPPIDGATVGAFFEGNGVIRFAPPGATARKSLKENIGKDTLEAVAVTSAYLFTLRADSPLTGIAATAGGTGRPANAGVYEADKSAMRQLGLDLTEYFLNREGPAKGSTYVLFPMQEIRGPRSEEARLLYSFVPIAQPGVELAVFGHEEMAEVKPFKFRFYDLCAYEAAKVTGGPDLKRSVVDISLGRTANSAQEKATLEVAPGAGARALRLDFAITMPVAGIRQGDTPLQFLQWKELNNDPDFDESVLMALTGPATGPTTLTIESAGLLFEPWFDAFVLLDENNWFPHPRTNDEFLSELKLTIPKNLVGIGVGEKVSENVSGQTKTVVFRSTQPATSSTFYYGDYTMDEMKADDVTVELYQGRKAVAEQKNAKFTLTEITNAMKVFSRMYGPLDIKSLRVAATRTTHGRGFEGLLLLGGGGTSTSSSSLADIFRAHEVAHQWWGNYVRPLNWSEYRWIGESFAEYSAMEYYKIRFEDHSKAVEVMTDEWLEPLTEGTVKRESLTGEKEKIIGGTSYPISDGTNNVYTKGPLVLHMLRYMFTIQKNDEAFFAMLKDFLQQYKYRWTTTADFRKVAEKHLGSDLGWFFEQWIEDGGLPVVKWNHTVKQEGDKFLLTVNARQEQKSYRLVVPVYVRFPGDKAVVRPFLIEGEKGTFNLRLPMAPQTVSLNDNLESLIILKSLREGAEGG